jgi:hypothetical protein
METLCKSRLAILAQLPARPSVFPLFYQSTQREQSGLWPAAVFAYFESLYALWINILLIDAPETEADRIQYFITQSANLLHEGAAPHPITAIPPAPLDPETPNLAPPEAYVALWADAGAPHLAQTAFRLIFIPPEVAKLDKQSPRQTASPAGHSESGLSIRAASLLALSSDTCDPHAYVFVIGGACSPRAKSGTPLSRMYASARGAMCPITPGGSFVVDVGDCPADAHIGIFVFCRVNSDTIVPTYDVLSRGFARLSDTGLTTFVGPMSSSYKVDPGTFHTTADFAYTPHWDFAFDSRPHAPLSTPAPIFSADAALALNRYSEAMYDAAEEMGLRSLQSFIYRGLTALVPIVVVGYASAETDLPDALFDQSIARLCARRGMNPAEFVSALEPGRDSEAQKQLVIEAIALTNTLVYRPDRLLGRDCDVHQSVRLTNSGDCEDAAEALFRILRRFHGAATRPESAGLAAIRQYIARNGVAAMMTHMRVTYPGSDSHVVAAGIPMRTTGEPDSTCRLLFLEGTAPDHASFRSSNGDAETRWRSDLAKSVPKKSSLSFYPEPPAQFTGDPFYKGFVGGIVCRDGAARPEYCFFSATANRSGVVTDGVPIDTACIQGGYTLQSCLRRTDEPWMAQAHAEMKRLGGFFPPLPMPAERVGEFPAEYRTYLARVEAHAKPGKSSRKQAFALFLNLCMTKEKFEQACEAIGNMSKQCDVVTVTGFSTFPGTALVEIDFR